MNNEGCAIKIEEDIIHSDKTENKKTDPGLCHECKILFNKDENND